MSLLRRLPRSHLDIRRLHVFLRLLCADFLMGLRVGFLAVAGAVEHTFASDAWFEGGLVGVRLSF